MSHFFLLSTVRHAWTRCCLRCARPRALVLSRGSYSSPCVWWWKCSLRKPGNFPLCSMVSRRRLHWYAKCFCVHARRIHTRTRTRTRTLTRTRCLGSYSSSRMCWSNAHYENLEISPFVRWRGRGGWFVFYTYIHINSAVATLIYLIHTLSILWKCV